MKVKLFAFLVVLLSLFRFDAFATGLTCTTPGCNGVGDDNGHGQAGPPPPGNPMERFGCYGGIDCRYAQSSFKLSDMELLNLKESKTNAKVAVVQSAIQINQSDFENIVQTGKSILFSQGFYDYFYMNMGIADDLNAQTWTLPSNLAEYTRESTLRLDILLPSQIPLAMQVAGATHVLKEVISEPNGNEADAYMHLQIDGTEITDLGTSYDFDEGSDDNFDEEPDVELYDVPLDLGDSQTTEDFPIDEISNENYLKINTVTTVDAFGIINTPYGNFDCLRQTEITKYFWRTSSSGSYGTTPNYEFRRVKWVTKNGFVFSAAVQSEDVNHVGLLGFMEQTRFVPTNTLTSQSAVKINNDSHGVTINNTDFVADASAVLDISSDSLGILIPRTTQAHRPNSPAEGLLVYQVDNGAGFYYFDGTAWNKLSATPSSSMQANARTTNSTIKEKIVIQGKSQLQNGTTFIKFDSPHDDFENLIINIQLEGDCNGVYISRKTRGGFELKELQKGKSNVKIIWSIN